MPKDHDGLWALCNSDTMIALTAVTETLYLDYIGMGEGMQGEILGQKSCTQEYLLSSFKSLSIIYTYFCTI